MIPDPERQALHAAAQQRQDEADADARLRLALSVLSGRWTQNCTAADCALLGIGPTGSVWRLQEAAERVVFEAITGRNQ